VTATWVAVVAKSSHAPIQWWTLAWIVGAAAAATLIIATIVVLSRRPKSMEDGMAEFSRSLQAVAPSHRVGTRQAGEVRPVVSRPYEERAGRRGRSGDV
jgi:hypothetical protein